MTIETGGLMRSEFEKLFPLPENVVWDKRAKVYEYDSEKLVNDALFRALDYYNCQFEGYIAAARTIGIQKYQPDTLRPIARVLSCRLQECVLLMDQHDPQTDMSRMVIRESREAIQAFGEWLTREGIAI